MSALAWAKQTARVLLVLAASAAGIEGLVLRGALGVEQNSGGNLQADGAHESATATVTRGPLRVIILEQGLLETSEKNEVYCPLDGPATIIAMRPAGTRVKHGELVCELDSSELQAQLKLQRTATERAEAARRIAQVAREVAEVAVVEYVEGVYPRQRNDLKQAIAVADSVIRKAEIRLERTRRARERLEAILAPKEEALTPAEIVSRIDLADRLDVAERTLAREKMARERSRGRLETLEQYTRDRAIRELKLAVEKATAEELATQQARDLEQNKAARLARQIESCKLLATGDGVVDYPFNPFRARPGDFAPIEVGASVQARQKVFSVPNIGKMLVELYLAESLLHRIKPGLKARIMVDAYSGLEFEGSVADPAPLPSERISSQSRPGRQIYAVRVALERGHPGLRPGMMAQVEIFADELENVLRVPVTAVIRYQDKDHVAVKKPNGEPGWHWREVSLGGSDGKLIEVKQGVQSGEVVGLQPITLMSEAEKRARFGGRSNTPALTEEAPR